MATAPRNPNDELWTPRCPKCGDGKLMLAPANQYTKYIVAAVEVYCEHCQWIGRMGDHIKQVYVRM